MLAFLLQQSHVEHSVAPLLAVECKEYSPAPRQERGS